MILATKADRPAVEVFLRQHITTSMFPLSNLRRYGMAGGHGRAMSFWLNWRDGRITDALGLSDEGFLFPQCPTGPWGALAAVLAGQAIKGLLGAEDQVAALRRCLALDPDAKALDTTEPQFTLPLADLVIPDKAGFRLVPLDAAFRDIATRWRAAYIMEVMQVPGEDGDAKAVQDVDNYIAAGSHRVLLRDGSPVAMTGFNADLPEAVQIGGVYVPPVLRRQGLARRAVALHLAEARANGVGTAVLFAASDNAARAYQAIGFRRVGAFSVLVFGSPQVIHG
ncbi:GNAT family N-acetyltransferase [Yoonia sp.]|uniref:GNAT family N-acetyltransferase n=1 Tax=Yoonia sp. TaxID=2212373 RepID=UPI002FDB1BE7